MLVYDDQCWYLAADWQAINMAQRKFAPNPQVAALESPAAAQASFRPNNVPGDCLIHHHRGNSQRFRQREGHIFFTTVEIPHGGDPPLAQRIDDFFYQQFRC